MKDDLVNRFVSSYSVEQQRLIFELVARSGIEPNDPMFLTLIAAASAQTSVAPIPELLRTFHTELHSTLVELRATAQDYQGRTALLLSELEKLQSVIKVSAYIPRAGGQSVAPPPAPVSPSASSSGSDKTAIGIVLGVIATVLLAVFFQLSLRSQSQPLPSSPIRPQTHSGAVIPYES